MKFNVGPYVYKVASQSEIRDQDGNALLGDVCGNQKTIRISESCPAASTLELLCHELAHAWAFHIPRPTNDEEWCDMFATMAAALVRDIERQGGTSRLLTLHRSPTMESVGSMAAGSVVGPLSYECSRCQQTIGRGSVVRSEIYRHERIGSPVIRLKFWCDFCEHVEMWVELATPTGLPAGVQVDKHEFLTGDEADEFCRLHPHEAGIRL